MPKIDGHGAIMIKEALFRSLTKLFLPSLARNMEEEGTFRVFEGKNAVTDETEYFRVDDRGSDVSIFVFSGMDVLFAGEPRFEFRRQLEGLGYPVNTVFIRELRRSGYMFAPDGSPTGSTYYERKVNELKRQLGARVNIAMGASGGGLASFYFGTRCGFDHAIGFSPAFPISVWLGWRPLLKVLFNLRQLLTHPTEYIEVLLVAISANVIEHVVSRTLPPEQIVDAYELYASSAPRPSGTIFYGERCIPDAEQARIVGQLEGITLRPVPTGRHNCPGHLKERGKLADALHAEIRGVLRMKGINVADEPFAGTERSAVIEGTQLPHAETV